MRHPHPEVLQVLDPRPLLDEAASTGARYRTGGLLIVETLAVGVAYGHRLWFGTERSVGGRLAEIAADLDIGVNSPARPDRPSQRPAELGPHAPPASVTAAANRDPQTMPLPFSTPRVRPPEALRQRASGGGGAPPQLERGTPAAA